MLASTRMNGFIPTIDAAKARTFYEGVLGFAFVTENPHVAMLRGGSASIIMQKLKEFTPAQYTILGWEVDDIDAAAASLVNAGVKFERYPWIEQNEMGIWKHSEGAVGWFKDPDGNILSISEHGDS